MTGRLLDLAAIVGGTLLGLSPYFLYHHLNRPTADPTVPKEDTP